MSQVQCSYGSRDEKYDKTAVSSSKAHSANILLCRVDIRKGLNALKREIPGGDTFMHLGLQRVSLCCSVFMIFLAH